MRLDNLVEMLESKLRDLETRMQDDKEKQATEKKKLESKIIEMETRLQSKDKEMEELKKTVRGVEASISKMMEKESSKDHALTKPCLRDLPIVFISAWQSNYITSPQTVTFNSYLANFNNANRPGGGDGVLNLDSGVFTCFTP